MPHISKHNVTQLKDGADIASACATALAETCKALKAHAFYPEGHPLRDRIINAAYQAVAGVVRDDALSVIVQRNGFSFADQDLTIANTQMTAALAHELFAREIQRLTLLPDLSPADFTHFIALLAIEPQKVSAAGGLAALLKQQGVATVLVNEIDITAVFTKKRVGVADETAAAGASAREAEQDEAESRSAAPRNETDPDENLTIEELVARMSAETDDTASRQWSRKLLAKAQPLKIHGDFDRLYTVLLPMAQQHADADRSPVHRDCALNVLQHLALGEAAEHLLDHLEDEEYPDKESVSVVLAEVGPEIVDAVVARLTSAVSRVSLGWLTTILCRIGHPAFPALSNLLREERWQVLQAAAMILGEMGLREAAKPLALTALHYDDRVRMEAIRSLAKIGGMEATSALLDLLRNGDEAAAIQVITWLGNTRNHSSLQALLQLVLKRDPLGKSQNLKKAALAAIGRIGDRRALEPLFKLVRKRHLIMSGRWAELKLLAIGAIGNIGGQKAEVFLEEAGSKGGPLGQACSAALAAMANRKPAKNV